MSGNGHGHVTRFGVIQCDECQQWHVFRQTDEDEPHIYNTPFKDKAKALEYGDLLSKAFRVALDAQGAQWEQLR
jgi:hypothetical protein